MQLITLFYYLTDFSNFGLLFTIGCMYFCLEVVLGFKILQQEFSSFSLNGVISGILQGLMPLTIDIIGFIVILMNKNSLNDEKQSKWVTVVVLLYIVFRFPFFIIALYKKMTLKWSEYQGYLDWDKATAKCKNLNMRLPTISEMKSAYNLGDTGAWLNDGHNYWTSEEFSEKEAYYFSVKEGTVHHAAKEVDRHARYLQ